MWVNLFLKRARVPLLRYFLIIIIFLLWATPLYAEDAKSHYEKGATYLMNAAFAGHTIDSARLLDKAIIEFKEAVRLNPKYVEAYYDLGLAYKTRGKDEQALASFKKAIEIKPDSTDAYMQSGDIYYKKKDYTNALLEYKRIVEIEPKKITAYTAIGKIYVEMKDYSSAISYLKKGLQHDPEHLDLHFYLGNAYYGLKMYDNAISEYKIILKERPEEGIVYYRLGLAYKEKGFSDLAEGAFNKTMEYSPFTDEEAGAMQELLEIKKKKEKRK